MIYLAIGILLSGVAIVLAYLSRWEAVAAAFAALLMGSLSGMAHIAASSLWFWAVAALIGVGISVLLPAEVRHSRAGVAYFCTGALVGAVLGILLNTHAGIIVGCAAGLLLGAFALGRTPQGQALGFPSKKFFNYLLAKGMPEIVTFSMCAILLAGLIAK